MPERNHRKLQDFNLLLLLLTVTKLQGYIASYKQTNGVSVLSLPYGKVFIFCILFIQFSVYLQASAWQASCICFTHKCQIPFWSFNLAATWLVAMLIFRIFICLSQNAIYLFQLILNLPMCSESTYETHLPSLPSANMEHLGQMAAMKTFIHKSNQTLWLFFLLPLASSTNEREENLRLSQVDPPPTNQENRLIPDFGLTASWLINWFLEQTYNCCIMRWNCYISHDSGSMA